MSASAGTTAPPDAAPDAVPDAAPDDAARIERIETFDVRVPLDRVRADSVNATDAWGFATVRLTTADGLVGTGYTGTARGAGNRLVLDAVHDHYAEQLLGADSRDIRSLWQRMYWSPLHWCGRAGVSHMALAAVDIALWDLAAQRAGRPLCDLLGGSTARTLRAYDTNGGWLSFTTEELVASAAATLDAGFPAVKIKVGRDDGAEDVARVAAVRAAIGDAAGLMVDANQAWSLTHASWWGRLLEEHRVGWLEEPLDPDDWRGHARLAREVRTPIALGEHLYTARAFGDFVLAEAVHYVQPDATRLGGISEFLRVADLAAAHNLPVCPHAGDMMQVHQHLVFTAPTALWFEHIPWGRELFVDPAVVRDGAVHRPVAPGAGTAMKHDVVTRFLAGPVRTSEVAR